MPLRRISVFSLCAVSTFTFDLTFSLSLSHFTRWALLGGRRMKISNGGGRREVKEFSFLCCLAMKILHHFCLPLETLFFTIKLGSCLFTNYRVKLSKLHSPLNLPHFLSQFVRHKISIFPRASYAKLFRTIFTTLRRSFSSLNKETLFNTITQS